MASINEDSVDFNKLERDVYAAMEAEARYSRENSAKFRAVDQKVATYEEFRDIVKAAHLRPLEKKDKMPEKFVQPWNTTVIGKEENKRPENGMNAPEMKKPMKPPANSLALANHWRRLKTDQEKLDYLLFIRGDRLKKIFATEISGGLLSEILRVLLGHQVPDVGEVTQIIQALSSAKRFKLDLQFMSSSEKETCRTLFVMLKEHVSTTAKEGTEKTTDGSHCVTLEDVENLATLFDITL